MTRLGKSVVLAILVFVSIFLVYLFFKLQSEEPAVEEVEEEPVEVRDWPEHSVIGKSVEGLDVELYRYQHDSVEDTEASHVVFVGGIHGGYEWNSVLLAYQLMDYLEENPDFLPEDVILSVVPSANPDGVKSVIGKTGRFDPSDVPPAEDTVDGRFNANGVDLNRNFDCNWAPESMWRDSVTDAGTEPFSEPEAKAIRDLVSDSSPDAVIFWHSASGAVYGSECNEGILPGTIDIMNAYATAAGYPAVPSFDHYEITGDVEGWLASVGIPSITVELTTHDSLEWEKNKAGVKSVLEYFGRETI